MQDIMGIINLNENENRIKELTADRPIGAIPIAGRFRVIDFILSNLVNVGIHNVAVFTNGKARSLIEHLGSGKEWDLNRKRDGLFIFNPFINLVDHTFMKGDIKNFKDQLDYIKRCKEKYVILSKSYMICNIDFTEAFQFHKNSGSDITIIYKKVEDELEYFKDCDSLNLNEDGDVISIGNNIGKEEYDNISMDMYLLQRDLLVDIIEECISKGEDILLKEAINRKVSSLKVNSFCFDGYLGCINSVENYYRINMQLLETDILKELFYKSGYIYTKVSDEPSTKYNENALVNNAMIANGCRIDGIVDGSILARGVSIGKGAVVKDSIIMAKCNIEEGVELQHVILDKNVTISSGKVLRGVFKKPLVIMKNDVI